MEQGVVTIPKKPVVQPKEVKELPTPEPIDTSDWKTYRNEEYRFEIKYPPELFNQIARTYDIEGYSGIEFSYSNSKFIFIASRYWEDKHWVCQYIFPQVAPHQIGIQVPKEINGVRFERVEIKPAAESLEKPNV